MKDKKNINYENVFLYIVAGFFIAILGYAFYELFLT